MGDLVFASKCVKRVTSVLLNKTIIMNEIFGNKAAESLLLRIRQFSSRSRTYFHRKYGSAYRRFSSEMVH